MMRSKVDGQKGLENSNGMMIGFETQRGQNGLDKFDSFFSYLTLVASTASYSKMMKVQ